MAKGFFVCIGNFAHFGYLEGILLHKALILIYYFVLGDYLGRHYGCVLLQAGATDNFLGVEVKLTAGKWNGAIRVLLRDALNPSTYREK